MSGRPQFDGEYIESEFEAIGKQLDRPQTVYLIGGGSLALRGLKESTKDIDIVVDSSESHEHLFTALSGMGYDEVDSLEEAYQQMDATSCVENQDGCRIDIFDRQVMGRVVLSDGVMERSETWGDTGELSVNLVSPEDVFLFKAVATRPEDIGDIRVLAETGLDFDVIERELEVQVDLLNDFQFVTFVGEALGELAEQFGVTLPFEERVAEIADQYYDALEIQLAIDRSTSAEDLQAQLEIGLDELEARLAMLERMGRVVYEDGVVRLTDET